MAKQDGTREGTAGEGGSEPTSQHVPEERERSGAGKTGTRTDHDPGPDRYKEMSDGAGKKVKELVDNKDQRR
jgi:hypothetical protein